MRIQNAIHGALRPRDSSSRSRSAVEPPEPGVGRAGSTAVVTDTTAPT